ncbi:unnamed protein product [Kuraishia capsulata CBS 1993]|uniref:Atos-like conserved domain-containing protein n=1 Tax=Kuraishia capsulata CBS 1993 TaxID=1382522 RepID=W6MQ65_9ASCO|nr:uncharacterized protein KUCA_T00004864001 [Kuraishia capsulata CBS 1993]CDK28879.1 unnamed protein product [Kuraishia capsulata CBS 1993]
MPIPPLTPPTAQDGFHGIRARRHSSLSIAKNLEDISLEEDDDELFKPIYCFRCHRQRKDKLAAISGASSKADETDNSASNSFRRRRSSNFSLMGSFQDSLLSGRTAGFASDPIPFTAKMGVFPTVSEPNRKYYKPLTVPFKAVFYNWRTDSVGADSSNITETPYVGAIDLEKSYIEKETQREKEEQSYSKSAIKKSRKRRFPGYLLPKTGILQIVIFNKERTICNFNVVKYDLSDLPKNSKKIVRKNSYALAPPKRDRVNPKADPSAFASEKTLVSTLELKFANVNDKNYYVYDNIKVIFHNRAFPANLNPSGNDSESKLDNMTHSGHSALDVDYYTKLCNNCDHHSIVQRPVFKSDKPRYIDVFTDDEHDCNEQMGVATANDGIPMGSATYGIE